MSPWRKQSQFQNTMITKWGKINSKYHTPPMGDHVKKEGYVTLSLRPKGKKTT